MDGYLLDTNSASVLWDARHADYDKIRSLLASVSTDPVWVSIITIAEIEYGLKTALKIDTRLQKTVRGEMSKFSEVLSPDRHTIAPYSDVRSELFKAHAPRNRKGRLTKKWPEDLFERTSAKELHGVQENDIWIAALAIQYNLMLVTDDRMAPILKASQNLPDPLRIEKWR